MSTTDHVVFRDNAFRCLHCGASEPVGFPIDVMVFVKASKRFLKPHRDCKPLATVSDDWDDVTDMDLSVQHLEPLTAEHLAPVALPTLHAIGLGPQLAEIERIYAASAASKHAGESIRDPGAEHHWLKAAGHLTHDGTLDSRDPATNARHIIHAAARLLMAAACFDASEQSERRIAAVKQSLTTADCLDAESATIPLNCTRCEGTGAEPPGCPESGPCEQCGGWTETKRAIARGEAAACLDAEER